ncbi:MAG: Kae1-associated kinase Bud32 [Thermofilaceae archaeon]
MAEADIRRDYLDLLGRIAGLEASRVIGVGAEALLIEGYLGGLHVVAKYRVPKVYRAEQLDARLRRSRTALEAKLLGRAAAAGVNVPHVIYVDAEEGLLVLTYIEGERMKELLQRGCEDAEKLAGEIGYMVGVLHNEGIIHGDLTTSNIIVRGGRPYIIDFGLGFFSHRTEDAGVDLHLFKRALESTHPSLVEGIFSRFIEGYRSARGIVAEEVLRKVEEIRMRGRYVAQRRRKLFW